MKMASSVVNAPITVEGRAWDMINVGSRRERLPADAGQRLVSFTELVATAIAGAQARLELRRFAEEQAALRRVATLVARAAPPDQVFAAVTAEAGRVLTADVTVLNRYAPDGTESVAGVWVRTGSPPASVGTRVPMGGRNVTSLVFQTGQPVRIDEVTGVVAETARELLGARSAVTVKALARRSAVPVRLDIRVEGRLPEPVEVSAYYVIAEALTNAAKPADLPLRSCPAGSSVPTRALMTCPRTGGPAAGRRQRVAGYLRIRPWRSRGTRWR
jgi:hypothetical protein